MEVRRPSGAGLQRMPTAARRASRWTSSRMSKSLKSERYEERLETGVVDVCLEPHAGRAQDSDAIVSGAGRHRVEHGGLAHPASPEGSSAAPWTSELPKKEWMNLVAIPNSGSARPRGGLPLCAGLAQMAPDIADEVDADLPLHEAPLPSTALETVVVPATGDGLQRQIGQRLQHGDV